MTGICVYRIILNRLDTVVLFMNGQMSLQVSRLCKTLGTLVASVRFLTGMRSLVLLQCRRVAKTSRTVTTLVVLLAGMHSQMNNCIRCIVEILIYER
jgi:hypothetical protein